MKYVLVLAAATLALAGCKKAESSDEAMTPAASTTSAMAAANSAPAMMSANGSPPGTYDVTAKDGTKTSTMLMADGSYMDMDASGKQIAKGTWSVKDGKTCFHPDGQAEACYTESAPAADGTFTATPDKGDPVTVKKAA